MAEKIYTLLTAGAPQAPTSSTNATPIEITKNAHGYVTGDEITIVGHTTNTAANGTWKVTRTGANTFTLDGSVGNGVGGADGVMVIACKRVLAVDFENFVFEYDSTGTPTATIKFCASSQYDLPDFAATKSATNRYEYIDVIDTEDGASIDGDTGVALAGSPDNRRFEGNINGARWIGAVITAGSAGVLNLSCSLYNSNRP